MKSQEIDNFLDSFSETVLKEKWESYVSTNQQAKVSVKDLLSSWRFYYDQTFDIGIVTDDYIEEINTTKPERDFGFFYSL